MYSTITLVLLHGILRVDFDCNNCSNKNKDIKVF